MKKYKKTFRVILLIILLFLISILVVSFSKSSKTDRKIKDFTSRAVYVETIGDTEYYKVIKDKDFEDGTNVLTSHTDKYIGSTGDIYITSTDFTSFFVTKFFIRLLRSGHAGIVAQDDALKTYEIVGNNKNNKIDVYDNDWSELKNFNEYVVLRVKGVKTEEKEKLANHLESIKGCKYNYFFFLTPKNRYYCTDLVSRAYKDSLDIEISKENIVTGANMISSDNTYIIYYKKEVKNSDIRYQVYYLSED